MKLTVRLPAKQMAAGSETYPSCPASRYTARLSRKQHSELRHLRYEWSPKKSNTAE
jgi:hypothetical protein